MNTTNKNDLVGKVCYVVDAVGGIRKATVKRVDKFKICHFAKEAGKIPVPPAVESCVSESLQLACEKAKAQLEAIVTNTSRYAQSLGDALADETELEKLFEAGALNR